MDRQQEFVLRTIEERDIRFVRLWFTDVLGTLKSVAVAPAELEGAFSEGIGFDGSAIEGFARVFEADMLAKPDPATFQVLPWRGESPGTARMFCDLADARRLAELRRPAPGAAAGAVAGRRAGLHLLHPPRDRVLPHQGRAGRRAASPSRSTTRATSTTSPHGNSHDFRRADDHHARGDGHLGRVQPPRGRPGPERDRPAVCRRAHHRRQHHDVQDGRQGGRAGAGHLRDVHAEAVRGSPGLGDAHAPQPVRGRHATRSTRPARPTS